jgi:hypothetical protein
LKCDAKLTLQGKAMKIDNVTDAEGASGFVVPAGSMFVLGCVATGGFDTASVPPRSVYSIRK